MINLAKCFLKVGIDFERRMSLVTWNDAIENNVILDICEQQYQKT